MAEKQKVLWLWTDIPLWQSDGLAFTKPWDQSLVLQKGREKDRYRERVRENEEEENQEEEEKFKIATKKNT